MIFIDTGAFVARYVQRDQYHQQAQKAWRELGSKPWRYYTSNHVLDETFTLLARRTSYAFAAQRARVILSSDSLEILRSGYDDELQALQLFEKFADQQVSFTDCLSFVLMCRQSIHYAFSFDRHFSFAGFTMWPESPL